VGRINFGRQSAAATKAAAAEAEMFGFVMMSDGSFPPADVAGKGWRAVRTPPEPEQHAPIVAPHPRAWVAAMTVVETNRPAEVYAASRRDFPVQTARRTAPAGCALMSESASSEPIAIAECTHVRRLGCQPAEFEVCVTLAYTVRCQVCLSYRRRPRVARKHL